MLLGGYDPEGEEDKLPEMQGFLEKDSPSSLVGFQRRMCILKHRKFAYYKLAKDGTAVLQGELNFDQYRVTLIIPSGKKDNRF